VSTLTATRTRSLVETLPYWELHDGVMFMTDGRIEIGVEVKFPPAMFMTDGSLELLFRQLKNVIRNAVPQGQRLRAVIEVAPPGVKAIEPYRQEITTEHDLAALLGEKRAEYYENLTMQPNEVLEWRAFLTVTLGEKRLAANPNLGSYMLGKVIPAMRTRTHVGFTQPEFDAIMNMAHDARTRLTNFLASAGFNPKAMDSQDVFALCFRFFNPGLKQARLPEYKPTWQYSPEEAGQKLKGLAPPSLRAQIAKSEVDNAKLHEMGLGWKRIRMMGLTMSPDETQFGMINSLLDGSGDFYLVIDLMHELYEEGITRLKGLARKYYSASVDTKYYVDPNVRTGLAETEAAIEHMSANGDHIYQVGVTLVAVGTDTRDLEDRMTRAYSAAAAVPGSPFTVMQSGLWEPFSLAAPFSGNTIDQRVSMLETNAAHFFPVGSPWLGHDKPIAMFHNRWKTLTNIDPFDPNMTNWNALIVGGSGQGKTFFTQYLVTELTRQDDVDVIIVDRGRGYEKTVELLGGVMIDVEPGGDMSVNPFDLEEGELEPDEEKVAFLGAIIRAMIGTVDSRSEAEEDAIITAAIRTVYSRKTDEVFENGQYVKKFEGVLLRDFVKTLTNLERIGEKTISAQDKEIADTLARTLQNWTGKSPLGSFVDRPTNVPIGSSRVVCYDTSKFRLDSPLAAVGTMLIADLAWRRVKADKSRRKIVIFDECWALLEIPAAANFMVELYRRARRYLAAVWSISQSLEDFRKPQAQGILQNTTYHYLLRVPGEDDAVRELLRLPDSAMETFRNLRRVDGLYSEVLAWVRREGGVEGDVIWVRPSPLDFWAFTTSARDMVRRDAALARHDGHLLPALLELAYGREEVKKGFFAAAA
jgi:conjugal transfer ATP-binding protein TraC